MTRDAETTSRIMAAVHNRDTKPELALRTALWRRGLRYRLRMDLPGKPDIIFPRCRLAVFVDGDFWHGNAWRIRGMPSFDAQFTQINNADFWRKKILANMERDSKVNETLTASGWTVFRVFESRLLNDLEGVATQIELIIRRGRAGTATNPDVIVTEGRIGG